MLEKGVAIAQHHDGVSGTSKQHVAYDYAKKIQAGINEASNFVESVLKNVIRDELDLHVDEIQYCQLQNQSICELSQVIFRWMCSSLVQVVWSPFMCCVSTSKRYSSHVMICVHGRH